MKLDVNQPLSTNGQLHWAFNDISTYKQPTCKPIMNELYEQKQGYLTSNQVAAPSPSIDYSLMQIANNSQAPQVMSTSSNLFLDHMWSMQLIEFFEFTTRHVP